MTPALQHVLWRMLLRELRVQLFVWALWTWRQPLGVSVPSIARKPAQRSSLHRVSIHENPGCFGAPKTIFRLFMQLRPVWLLQRPLPWKDAGPNPISEFSKLRPRHDTEQPRWGSKAELRGSSELWRYRRPCEERSFAEISAFVIQVHWAAVRFMQP